MSPILARRESSASRRRKFLTSAAAALVALAAALAAAPAARAQGSAAPEVVISQFYAHAGQPGAPQAEDYVELFNRGTASVDINNWSLQISTSSDGGFPTNITIGFVSTGGIVLAPGQFWLVRIPNFGPSTGLGTDRGRIALVRNRDAIPTAVCPVGQDPDIVDFVGYGPTSCYDGSGPAPAPTLTAAAQRAGGGCADTNNNAADFALAAPNPHEIFSPARPCQGGPASESVLQFSAPQFEAGEGATRADVTVTRAGDADALAAAVTVDYATADSTASERQDYTTALGTLRFAPGETSKTFSVLLTDDAYSEPAESVRLTLSNPSSRAALGTGSTSTLVINDNDPAAGASNPIDDATFFVRQHYHDFLNRDPDPSGLAFWTNQITECEARPEAEREGCREVRRINVSAAFFLSIEFQETGYLVHRMYRAALPENRNRPRALPRYREFVRDTQAISRGVVIGRPGAEQQLEANKAAFAEEFVGRTEFRLLYPSAMTPAQYVDTLNGRAGFVLSQAERDELVARLANNLETRATVLRRVAEDEDFRRAELRTAFVLMQYFGYLRRSPDESPDSDFTGYDFWLSKLNEFGGDYVAAEMVKAFITSPEYHARFAPPQQ